MNIIIHYFLYKYRLERAWHWRTSVNTPGDEAQKKTRPSFCMCLCNITQPSSSESLTQINGLTHFRWWGEMTGKERRNSSCFSTGAGREGGNSLSLGTTGLDVPPAEVLPTGLECLGPRPGIFSPLDLSMFILQWQGDGPGPGSSSLGDEGLRMRATRRGSGGCRSPCRGCWDKDGKEGIRRSHIWEQLTRIYKGRLSWKLQADAWASKPPHLLGTM